MKYLFALIIGMNFINAMENNFADDPNVKTLNQLSESCAQLKNKLEALEKRIVDQQKQTKSQNQQIQQDFDTLKLKIEFSNKDSAPPKINSYFNRNKLFLMLGLTSISFIAGYLVGSQSLKKL